MTFFAIEQWRIRQRAGFFINEANQLCKSIRFSDAELGLSRENAELLSEAYYLMSDAYKAKKLHDGHKTEPAKIAAIMCVVIACLNPIRPKINRSDKMMNLHVYANPMFAMRCGSSVVNHPFHRRAFEERLRFYDGLRNFQTPTLNKYISDVTDGSRNIGDRFEVNLSPSEITDIEQKINLFAVFTELKIYKQDQDG